MTKTVLAATHNKGKIKEFTRILEPYGISIIPCDDSALLESIVEDGNTFLENAIIKAKAVYEKYKIPVLADDSGLCIECLDNRPGIYSARYLEKHSLEEVIREVDETKDKERKATFFCTLVLIDKNGKCHNFTGTCEGYIGSKPKGTNGFGYDPIVYINNKSISEMTDSEKDKISHRAKALKLLEKGITNGIDI